MLGPLLRVDDLPICTDEGKRLHPGKKEKSPVCLNKRFSLTHAPRQPLSYACVFIVLYHPDLAL